MKVVSWAAVVGDGVWLVFAAWIAIGQLARQPASHGGAAFVVGYWVGEGIFGLFLLGAPILSILAVLFGGGLFARPRPERSVDAIFE